MHMLARKLITWIAFMYMVLCLLVELTRGLSTQMTVMCSGNLTHYTGMDCNSMGMDAPPGACFYTRERKKFDTCNSICNGVKTGSYIGMRSEASCKSRCKAFYESSCERRVPTTASSVATASIVTEYTKTSTTSSFPTTTQAATVSNSIPPDIHVGKAEKDRSTSARDTKTIAMAVSLSILAAFIGLLFTGEIVRRCNGRPPLVCLLYGCIGRLRRKFSQGTGIGERTHAEESQSMVSQSHPQQESEDGNGGTTSHPVDVSTAVLDPTFAPIVQDDSRV